MKAACALIVVLGPAVAMATEAEDNLKAFPPPEAGMTRHVLLLPQHDDEASRKVELIVGQTVETDKVNRYFFGGKIEAVTIDGWGFTRYVVRQLGPMAGTLIAVDPDAPQSSASLPWAASRILSGTTAACRWWSMCPRGRRSGTASGPRPPSRSQSRGVEPHPGLPVRCPRGQFAPSIPHAFHVKRATDSRGGLARDMPLGGGYLLGSDAMGARRRPIHSRPGESSCVLRCLPGRVVWLRVAGRACGLRDRGEPRG